MTKAHAHSWEVTDEFWKREPLVSQPVRDPQKQYKRAVGRSPGQAASSGVRGHHVCAAYRIPMEGVAV